MAEKWLFFFSIEGSADASAMPSKTLPPLLRGSIIDNPTCNAHRPYFKFTARISWAYAKGAPLTTSSSDSDSHSPFKLLLTSCACKPTVISNLLSRLSRPIGTNQGIEAELGNHLWLTHFKSPRWVRRLGG